MQARPVSRFREIAFNSAKWRLIFACVQRAGDFWFGKQSIGAMPMDATRAGHRIAAGATG